MSSFTRRIQRAHAIDADGDIKRKSGKPSGKEWGRKLGVTNPKDKALLARKARDAKWGRK